MNDISTKNGSKLKRMTLPFIGKSLKSMGIKAQRNGNAYYVDLGHNSCLVIGVQHRSISAAVIMPANREETRDLHIYASLTMAKSSRAMVFLLPKGGHINILFSAKSICDSRGEFKDVFDTLFIQLMKSVRTFVDIRYNISETTQARSLGVFIANQAKYQIAS